MAGQDMNGIAGLVIGYAATLRELESLRAALREGEARIDCGTRVEGECPTPLEPPMTPVCGYHANLWLVAEQERAGEAEAQRDRARRGGWMGALAAVSWQKLYDEQRERAEAAERERDAARQAHGDADAALQSLMAKYDPRVAEPEREGAE